MTGAASPILEVRDLRTSFHTREGEGRAVDVAEILGSEVE